MNDICGATTVFWPGEEDADAECILPAGHQPPDRHEDASLGEWTEEELTTSSRAERAGDARP